jgi:hypothetical protein
MACKVSEVKQVGYVILPSLANEYPELVHVREIADRLESIKQHNEVRDLRFENWSKETFATKK